MSSTARPQPSDLRSPRSKALIVGLAAAIASAVIVEIVAVIGKAAGAPHVNQLQPGPLALFTVLGVAIGTAAWVPIGRRPNGGRLLRTLVPAALVVSILPDVALGVNDTAWSAVLTLVIAHASVFTVTVPILLTQLRPAAIPTAD